MKEPTDDQVSVAILTFNERSHLEGYHNGSSLMRRALKAAMNTMPQAPEVEVWGIHHPTIGFRFKGVCVSTDIEDAIAWANAENLIDGTDEWKARKFRLSVYQPEP